MLPRTAYLVPMMMAASAFAQTPPDIRVPPEIGAAYGRLGKAIQSHDSDGVKAVWADDFVVNSPNNEILTRDQVIALMGQDFLDYKEFRKHISYVGVKPEVIVVMGHDTMIPQKGPGAGIRVTRPFTDIWAKRSGRWMLIARQATIASTSAK